ncbi:MAG: hypothetical protein PUF41_11300 [Prevotella copri]|nr:hypothetical protein [Segatella copri]
MGAIPSVSLPAIKTCRSCSCASKCYAAKLERLRPSVRRAYQKNLEILMEDPDTYWREVEAAIMLSRFFRFHVSGDIPEESYFEHMVSIADRNPHCQILCFTKKFDLVNRYLSAHNGVLPENLHILFSGWLGLQMDNPFSLPEAHVVFRDGSTTARKDAIPCGGNCTDCAITDGGCWSLSRGQQVVFKEH